MVKRIFSIAMSQKQDWFFIPVWLLAMLPQYIYSPIETVISLSLLIVFLFVMDGLIDDSLGRYNNANLLDFLLHYSAVYATSWTLNLLLLRFFNSHFSYSQI